MVPAWPREELGKPGPRKAAAPLCSCWAANGRQARQESPRHGEGYPPLQPAQRAGAPSRQEAQERRGDTRWWWGVGAHPWEGTRRRSAKSVIRFIRFISLGVEDLSRDVHLSMAIYCLFLGCPVPASGMGRSGTARASQGRNISKQPKGPNCRSSGNFARSIPYQVQGRARDVRVNCVSVIRRLYFRFERPYRYP